MARLGSIILMAGACWAHHVHHHQNTPVVAVAAPMVKHLAAPKLLGLPTQVVIPRQVDLLAAAPIAQSPVMHTTGLIQVQLPAQAPIAPIAPAAFATRPEFTRASPRMGKVVDQTAPTYFCKRPGFVLEGQTCVQTQLEAARYTCPGGFETFDGGCQRRATALQICPPGYTRRDGACAKIVTASFLQRCPDGAVPTAAGGCERQVAHPLTPTCPEGTYDARVGSCMVTVFQEARAFCPEGFAFVDGACLQEEVYDCTSSATTEALPLAVPTVQQVTAVAPVHHHGLYKKIGYAKGNHGALARRLTAAKDCSVPCAPPPPPCVGTTTCVTQVVQPVPCVAQRVAPCEVPQAKVVVQPTKTTVTVQKTCTRVTSTALIFACDEGTLQRQQCLVQQTVPPVPVCSAEGDANYCFARQRVPIIEECPIDYTKECLPGRPCECVALEAAAFTTSCPSGFEPGADGCVRFTQARAVCPPGFALQGDSCVKVLREPADCVFSVTYECEPATGLGCAPPPAGTIGAFSATPSIITTPVAHPLLPVPII